ncbi:outer membrane transport energization protein ExbD [Roseinatronobacter monicus]|uniref:Outer membrane transport energization protein ExbD n=2 Tax=Roseinatronobacter monicus TaxID=393481 RepID=A0A543KH59_9RHOB|nr:outer membrane transport energization protein ExbD [Roseinatronobacter monicus]
MPERLDLTPRRRRLSMTSLIDVIFLLLLFFMLSSTFARQGELPLDLAMGGAATPPDTPPAFIQLRQDGLRLDATETTPEALRSELQARGEGVLLLTLGEGVGAQGFAEILHLLQGLSGWRLAVLGAAP